MPMESTAANQAEILWEPSSKTIENANITAYMRWLKNEKGLNFDNYAQLWQRSVDELETFWQSLWEYFKIEASQPFVQVLPERIMPRAEWFPGAKLNYAEHVFRNMTDDQPALIFQSETQPVIELTWEHLRRNVTGVAAGLRRLGVQRGDRVASLMPNIPQTIIAFLACASIGAVWSSCSPDFGMRSITDRFKQIQPKVLFVVDGYQYGRKSFDREQENKALQAALPSLQSTVLVQHHGVGHVEHPARRPAQWRHVFAFRRESRFP
jgi:acetoacetyl-CoA synthetase